LLLQLTLKLARTTQKTRLNAWKKLPIFAEKKYNSTQINKTAAASPKEEKRTQARNSLPSEDIALECMCNEGVVNLATCIFFLATYDNICNTATNFSLRVVRPWTQHNSGISS
jgi:hypothetical protein